MLSRYLIMAMVCQKHSYIKTENLIFNTLIGERLEDKYK